jgi:hypothetical protein
MSADGANPTRMTAARNGCNAAAAAGIAAASAAGLTGQANAQDRQTAPCTARNLRMMTKNEFHNALRILTSIDAHELEAAGVIRHADHNAWGTFRRDPYRWFIRADDATAEKLWKIVERRMK